MKYEKVHIRSNPDSFIALCGLGHFTTSFEEEDKPATCKDCIKRKKR